MLINIQTKGTCDYVLKNYKKGTAYGSNILVKHTQYIIDNHIENITNRISANISDIRVFLLTNMSISIRPYSAALTVQQKPTSGFSGRVCWRMGYWGGRSQRQTDGPWIPYSEPRRHWDMSCHLRHTLERSDLDNYKEDLEEDRRKQGGRWQLVWGRLWETGWLGVHWSEARECNTLQPWAMMLFCLLTHKFCYDVRYRVKRCQSITYWHLCIWKWALPAVSVVLAPCVLQWFF